MEEVKQSLRPATPWVQIRVAVLAYPSCGTGPEVLCSHYPGALIAGMQGWPHVLVTASPPEVTGYQLPLPALGAACCSLSAAGKVLWDLWE